MTDDEIQNLSYLDDKTMAMVAWVAIRALADRGADLAREIADGLDNGQGAQWQIEEAIAQLEDLPR